ncbi:hypothetical protein Tco_1024815 [Tanacetum coccineum]
MQQPMLNPEDILDPTTALDMALKLMSKAFQLNNIIPTNNNQRSSSNPCSSQIAQSRLRISKGNGNVVAARAEGNSNEINGNPISALRKQRKKLPTVLLQENLQAASTSGTQSDKAPVYDLDGSAEGHHSNFFYDDDIFNMFTQEEHMEQGGGTVEQHPVNVEETRVLYDLLYNNLAIEVEKVNSVNRKLRETNSVYQEQRLTKKINALHLSSGKQITTLNEEISNLNKQLSKEKSTVSSLLEEKKRLKSDFKIREDELLDKQIQLKEEESRK